MHFTPFFREHRLLRKNPEQAQPSKEGSKEKKSPEVSTVEAKTPASQEEKAARQWMEKIDRMAEQTLTQEEWTASKKKERLQEGLVDVSRFLSSETKKVFEQMARQRVVRLADGRRMNVLPTDENGYSFVLAIKDPKSKKVEMWNISEIYSPYKGTSTNVIPFSRSWTTFWRRNDDGTVDKQMQFTVPNTSSTVYHFGGFVDRDKDGKNDYPYPFEMNIRTTQWELNPEGILKAIETAKQNRESELKDAAKVRAFDLPKDKDIGYICLYHDNPKDTFLRTQVDDAHYFHHVLLHAGYKLKMANREPVLSLKKWDPTEILLRERLQKLYKEGVRVFYINIFGHGSPLGTDFGGNELTPEHMRKLFDDFEDCQFIVNTVACQGGQLERSLWDYKDPSGKFGRIRLFLPTHIVAPNISAGQIGKGNPYQNKPLDHTKGEAPEEEKGYSSYYHIFLVHYLLQGKNYGEAHWMADQRTKALLGLANPQTWSSSPKGGVNTASKEKRKKPTL